MTTPINIPGGEMICSICGKLYCHCLLAKDWRPQPEGLDAQPKWSGKIQSENEKRMQDDPAFSEDHS